MEALRAAVRRSARIVWTLHLTLREGFDASMLATLRNRYPAELLDRLRAASCAFAAACAAAMPRGCVRDRKSVV